MSSSSKSSSDSKRLAHQRRVGRSIEEIMISKRLAASMATADHGIDGSDPTSWPEPRRSQSSINFASTKSTNTSSLAMALSNSLPSLRLNQPTTTGNGIPETAEFESLLNRNKSKSVKFAGEDHALSQSLRPLSKQGSLKDPSQAEIDKDQLLDSVKDYCRSLELRVKVRRTHYALHRLYYDDWF
jgi:hypothetical protein